MPKELSHWIIAELVSKHISPGKIKNSIASHSAYYYLGSVIYDCPFYAFFVDNSDELAKTASKLHGADGGDTLDPYRRFIRSYLPKDVPPEALSFLAGALTHLCTDVNFHPLVNYFSGKYSAARAKERHIAQRRHRQFESLLDLFLGATAGTSEFKLSGLYSIKRAGSLAGLLQKLINDRSRVENIVERFYFGEPRGGSGGVWELLKRHAQLQRLFPNGFLGSCVRAIGAIAGGGIRVMAATFYPVGILKRLKKNPTTTLPFFAHPITYRHPNTGAQIVRSIDELIRMATDESVELINLMQHAADSGSAQDWFGGKKAKSLTHACDVGEFPAPAFFDLSIDVPALCRHGQ